MEEMFNGATNFNQSVGQWTLSSDLNMTDIFQNTPALSNSNKIYMHASFSSNENWPYDWSYFPPPINVPIIKTFTAELSEDGTYLLGGKILTDGGSAPSEIGILLSENISFFSPMRLLVTASQNTDSFKIAYSNLDPDKTYYFKAFAVNEVGENHGNLKIIKTDAKVVSNEWYKKAESLPGGWKRSEWFGLFRPTMYEWIYHFDLGWFYPSPMQNESLWLWNQEEGWRWTQPKIYPYLFRWRDLSWIYFHGRFQGRKIYYNSSTQLIER